MTRKLIVGNWKMNGSLAANHDLLTAINAGLISSSCQAAVCVPAPYFVQVQQLCTSSPSITTRRNTKEREQVQQ